MLLLAAVVLIGVGGADVVSRDGVVVSDERLASEIGARILERGGNAVDAAVATGFALAVVQPAAGNLGGGGFLLVQFADGRKAFLDFREIAPKAATREMYKTADESIRGMKAAAVPGSVQVLWESHRRYGKLPWGDLVEPAEELAAKGFAVSESLSGSLTGGDRSILSPIAKSVYLPGGRVPKSGQNLVLPELAAVLGRIRAKGVKGFTEGPTAEAIERDMRERGGLVTAADLKSYRPKWRAPLVGKFRGYDVASAPPPSSGGVALLQMLQMREGWPADLGEADEAHLLAEIMKRAFADRAAFLGDPDFVRVPVGQLLSNAYLKSRRSTISLDKASQVPASGKIEIHKESKQTLHFSVVDREGNAVAVTTTLNGSYGCGDLAGGILMNNEMDDFAARPGEPNMYGLVQGKANEIAPGKRPLSSMTPTIVSKGGKVRLVLGSPGGPTIINTVFEVLLGTVEKNFSLRDAVNRGRIHHQWLPDLLRVEANALSKETLAELQRRGQKWSPGGVQGVANCIEILPSGLANGVADVKRRRSAWAAAAKSGAN